MSKRVSQFLALVSAFLVTAAVCDPVLATAEKIAVKSAMFYYGADPLPDELGLFDIVVIDPGAAEDLKKRTFAAESVYAYVSLGEVRRNDPHAAALDGAWIRSANEEWATHVMDQTAPGWRQFFIERIVAPIREKGVRNIFIDTMDSYLLFAKTPEELSRQEAGMVTTIRELKAKYPDMRIILNRGFEVIEPLKDIVSAVAVESLFRGWRHGEQSYVEVSDTDRTWLLGQVRRVRDTFGIPVIAIDYVAPAERDLARQTAKKISALGFVPCVTNGSLDMVGISTIEPLPRKILFLHDGVDEVNLGFTIIRPFGLTPIQYLGYVPEFLDVSKELPVASLVGRYAGIVGWFVNPVAQQKKLFGWLQKQKQEGIPIVFLSGFGTGLDSALLRKFGFLSTANAMRATKISVAAQNTSFMGFEMQPLPLPGEFLPLVQKGPADVLLDLVDEHGNHMHPAAITPWGGYVLEPFVIRQMGDAEVYRWVINPLLFFQKALKLPEMPVPDVTTHNGRRMLFVHIDGDGFVSKAEFGNHALAGQVILDEILKKYRIPTSVSVIEGEIAPYGLYPDESSRAEAIARQMFSLPQVEIASHSFSHPFSWSKLTKEPDSLLYHLAIPGYTFDPRREITGSINYIKERLAPQGKPVNLFHWTGDCNPDAAQVGLLEANGILGLNGGETLITRANPSWTAIGPMGRPKGSYFQVYAPNQNENVYTDLWTKRFYGYERAIETFQMTDRPYRFKPINIYYHMYSATKVASLKSLKKVYEYALKQDVVAVYPSEYIRKAQEFNRIAVGRTDNGYRVAGAREIRELRIPKAAGYPSLAGSDNVLGFLDHEQARYLHLTAAHMHDVVLASNPGRRVFIESVNADVPAWTSVRQGADFSLLSHQPVVKLRLGNSDGCSARVNGALRPPRMRSKGVTEYEIKGKENVLQTVTVRCAD